MKNKFFTKIAIATITMLNLQFSGYAANNTPIEPDHNPQLFESPSANADTSFVHTTTLSNVEVNRSILNHALLNGKPDAIFFVTQNLTPSGQNAAAISTKSIGVYYAQGTWRIFNQNTSDSMQVGLKYNILIPDASSSGLNRHTTTAANRASHITYLQSSPVAGESNGIYFVAQYWESVFNNQHIGVWFNGDAATGLGRGSIYNDSKDEMPIGAKFNYIRYVSNSRVFVHTTTLANTPINSIRTTLDHPLLNNNPDALIQVTHQYNTGLTNYNNHPIAVEYINGRWTIRNTDNGVMPMSTKFNVHIHYLSQTITNNQSVTRRMDESPLTMAASASSGLPVSYTSVTPNLCTVNGSTVTFLHVGGCRVLASQAGNDTYAAAGDLGIIYTVSKGNQSITFPPLSDKTLGSDPNTVALNATASSGLAVSYSSTSAGICSVAGSTVTLISAGICTITANQSGNSDWNAAEGVARSFTINAAGSATSTPAPTNTPTPTNTPGPDNPTATPIPDGATSPRIYMSMIFYTP